MWWLKEAAGPIAVAQVIPVISLASIDTAPIATAVLFVLISMLSVVGSIWFVQRKISEETKREIRSGFKRLERNLEREIHGWP